MDNNTISMSQGGLFSKVSFLLSLSMGITALGCYLGAGITSFVAIIVLAIAFIAGAIAVPFAAKASKEMGIGALAIWTFISGLFLGPTMNFYVAQLGWEVVFFAFLGTGGVMAACGAIGALSGRDFSGMGKWLTIGLLVLIVIGIVNIFMSFSIGFTIVYSLGGMAIFAGFFIYDFFRMKKAENTWDSAIMVTMQLYLNFINFLLHLLRFLLAVLGKKK